MPVCTNGYKFAIGSAGLWAIQLGTNPAVYLAPKTNVAQFEAIALDFAPVSNISNSRFLNDIAVLRLSDGREYVVVGSSGGLFWIDRTTTVPRLMDAMHSYWDGASYLHAAADGWLWFSVPSWGSASGFWRWHPDHGSEYKWARPGSYGHWGEPYTPPPALVDYRGMTLVSPVNPLFFNQYSYSTNGGRTDQWLGVAASWGVELRYCKYVHEYRGFVALIATADKGYYVWRPGRLLLPIASPVTTNCAASFWDPESGLWLTGDGTTVWVTTLAKPDDWLIIPRIEIVPATDQVDLLWSAWATGYVAEASAGLQSSYTSVTNRPQVVGDALKVSLDNGNLPCQFFRLTRLAD